MKLKTIKDQKRTEDQSDRAKEIKKLRQDKLDREAFDDRHWSKKPLDKMRERDWRILREDFSITTKGLNSIITNNVITYLISHYVILVLRNIILR